VKETAMSSAPQRKRNFTFESLENKEVLAGNVVAALAGNQLIIDGDAADNEIHIVEIAPNTIEVTGLGGTTVNGAAAGVFAAPLIEDISVNLHDGNDILRIRNVSLTDNNDGELKIRTENGDDVVELMGVSTTRMIGIDTGNHNDRLIARNTKTADYFTQTGNGHDTTILDRFFADHVESRSMDGHDRIQLYRGESANDIKVDSGTENDLVALRMVKAGNDLKINTEHGSDRVYASNIRVGHDVMIDTGTHKDRVAIRGLGAGNNVTVKLGSGHDSLYTQKVKAQNIYADAGNGNDSVKMIENHAAQDLHAYLGKGNDKFWIEGSSAANPHFDGGLGWDRFYIQPNLFPSPSPFYSVAFEVYI
jgi:hypothetical protein